MEGFLNTKLESYIQGNINALKYFYALPKYLIPDNDKSAVTVANKYDPLNNSVYQAMADHYGICIMPTRTRKPTDKGTVEKAVLDCAERSLARVGNLTIFSLEEFNAILHKEKAKVMNRKIHHFYFLVAT